jgi:hypothetical protein
MWREYLKEVAAGNGRMMREPSMANPRHGQQHQAEHAPARGTDDHKATEAPKPGLAAVEAIQGVGAPAAAQVAQVLRTHPAERDEIMTWLHQHRGNAFAQQVTQQLGQVEQAMPAALELQSVRASLTIPGKKQLGGDWTYAAKTREATQVGVEVSTRGVSVWLSPGLYIDVDFPGRDVELDGAGVDFASGKAHANVSDGGGIGVIPLKGFVSGKVTGMIEQAIAGTKLASHHYDPTHDPDLKGTLERVVAGFTKLFHPVGDAETTGKPPIAPHEMSRVSAGATVALKAGASFVKDGTGITIAGGAPLSIAVQGAGDLGHIMNGKDAQQAIDAMNVQAVSLSTEGLQVVAKGNPVAQLHSITLSRGGKVSIDHMTPLGKLANAEAAESGLSLLVALIAARSGDGNTAGSAMGNAHRPVVVDGISRTLIEQTFTDTIHKLILQYRTAVPGIDLAKSLGLS